MIDFLKTVTGFHTPARLRRWKALRAPGFGRPHKFGIIEAWRTIQSNKSTEHIQNDDIINGTNNMDKEKFELNA